MKLSLIMLLFVELVLPINLVAKKMFHGHTNSFDYIIVGFGSAGSVLARQLSNKQNGAYKNSVLVLEAGENHLEDISKVSPDLAQLSSDILSYNPLHATIHSIPVGEFDAKVYSEGRGWGGSAVHNGLGEKYGRVAHRGVPLDWNSMAFYAHDDRWLYNNVVPFMKSIEAFSGFTSHASLRGFSGPLFVTQLPSIAHNIFAQAVARATMTSLSSDYNDHLLPSTTTSPSQLFWTILAFVRRSFGAYDMMTVGEIMDEKGRGLSGRKVRVKGNCLVDRLLFDDSASKVIGVEYVCNKISKKSGSVKKVYAKKGVILCAGGINTPAVLMRSGIGDKTMLKKLAIDVVLDNPHVGAHLQNHYGATVSMTNSHPIPGGQLESFFDIPLGGAVRKFHVIAVQMNNNEVQLVGKLMQPKSVGFVSLISKDPLVLAKLNLNLYSDGSFMEPGTDAYNIIQFYHVAEKIAEIAGEKVLFPSLDDYTQGDARLFEVARSVAGLHIAYHATGTARISASKKDGVVDGQLRVHGIKHLMIADRSVMRPITSGHTFLPAHIIGLVAADILGVPLL